MSEFTSYYLYQKYESVNGGTPTPVYPPVYSYNGQGTKTPIVKSDNDPNCGYVPPVNPKYRWVNIPISTDYICNECESPSVAGDYLTFVALEDATIKGNRDGLQYSLDRGDTWTYMTGTSGNYKSELIPSGSSVWLKGYFNRDNGVGYPRINIYGDASFALEGNPLSLIYGDEYSSMVDKQIYNYAFKDMFANNPYLIDASNLIIPKVLSVSCCHGMFSNCSSLLYLPELPATTLASYCYHAMFKGCLGITSIPANYLPATTLASYCYHDMFMDCHNLMTVPSDLLPAETLASGCYKNMFWDCYSLTNVPNLLATTLADECYYGMFKSCTVLQTVPNNYLHLTDLKVSCYTSMFSNCSSLLYPPELPATTLTDGCYGSMFEGCTSFTDLCNYKLPAITLTNGCYGSMFSGCRSLTTPPELPAIILAEACYQSMFEGCTSLVSAPEKIDTDEIHKNSCNSMFRGCTSLVNPCNLYFKNLARDVPVNAQQSIMSKMYEGCTSLDHIEIMYKGATLDLYQSNWMNNTKSPFYLFTNTLVEDSSGATVYNNSLYGYKSLSRYIAEKEYTESSRPDPLGSVYQEEVITLTEPITSIKSIKLTDSVWGYNRYVTLKSNDDTISVKIIVPTSSTTTADISLVITQNGNVETINIDNALEIGEFNWITSTYNNWGITKPTRFANIDLYGHFGKDFYLEEIVVGTYIHDRHTKAQIIGYFGNIVDIVCGIENDCEGREIYQWRYYSVECERVAYDGGEHSNKYETQMYRKTVNNGITWSNVTPLQVRIGNAIEVDSSDCGALERWVNLDPSTDYYCSGTTKYYKQQRQVSYDSGSTWENVIPAEYKFGPSAQSESVDCGYAPSGGYLTFKALESMSISLRGLDGVYCSTDSGDTWDVTYQGSNVVSLDSGETVMWKGTLVPSSTGIGRFETSGHFEVEGNIMSLLYGDDFEGKTSLVGKDNAFMNLFYGSPNITTAENLLLPATTLANSCYEAMFFNCSSLTIPPELSATTLAPYCYSQMFVGCTSLSYIKCLATDISATGCTLWWTNGVASSGTFVKAANMSSWTTGGDGIPSGWTVQDA